MAAAGNLAQHLFSTVQNLLTVNGTAPSSACNAVLLEHCTLGTLSLRAGDLF